MLTRSYGTGRHKRGIKKERELAHYIHRQHELETITGAGNMNKSEKFVKKMRSTRKDLVFVRYNEVPEQCQYNETPCWNDAHIYIEGVVVCLHHARIVAESFAVKKEA